MRNNVVDWLRLYLTPHIGPQLFFQLVAQCGSVSGVLSEFALLRNHVPALSNTILVSQTQAEDQYAQCEALGVDVLLYDDKAYPLLLQSIDSAPPLFFVKGDMSLMQRPCVGMVGARNASVVSRKFAYQLALDLGHVGVTVVSGLARGIDTSVHQGALSTGTIAVIANGLDIYYPPENRSLADSIMEQGAILSEFPLGTTPQAGFFPRRNRIISGLSSVLVVLEASLNSGSLITAKYALEQGREVASVPGSPMDPRALGSNSLLKQGAAVVESVDDVLALLPAFVVASHQQGDVEEAPLVACDEEVDVSSLKQSIIQSLSVTPIAFDVLLSEMDVAPNVLLAMLLELELEEKVIRCHGNMVALAGMS